jgi:hypothetical protein
VVASFFVGKSIVVGRVAQSPASLTPFVLETEDYTYENGAEGELMVRRTDARRSDGSTALLEDILAPTGEHAARKVVFFDGTAVTLIDDLDIKTTWPRMTPNEVTQLRQRALAAPVNCAYPGDSLVGYGQVLGHPAAIVQHTPVSVSVSTSWKAADLGCVSLQYRIQTKQADGSLRLIAEGRAKSLRLEEPDPRLFDPGPTYTELKPSDRLRRELQSRGIPWNEQFQREGEDKDKLYSRPRK